MRTVYEKRERLFRVFKDTVGEVAYVKLGLGGLSLNIEFPSDWHEEQRAWVTLGLGFIRVGFSFHWGKVVPDEHQCSGPRYGFSFFEDMLFVYYGKETGRQDSPSKSFHMPWHWRFIEHKILSEKETHDFNYALRSGETQRRQATINKESREWWRPWFPFSLYRETIDIWFSDEVGERTGSWKGGTMGCGYNLLPNETPLECLRRMEKERKF